MKRVGGWLGATKHSNASTQSLSALDEPQALEEAMAAAAYILNDDVDTAEVELSKGNSPFHKLGKGVVAFLRAALGFEKEIMALASERLLDAENSAYAHQHRAHRDGYQSAIYPPGSEYALCYAEAQLMSAVVAVLSESLTESIKGFYKLRKAYATLQEISDAEKKYMRSKASSSRTSLSAAASQSSSASTSTGLSKNTAFGQSTTTVASSATTLVTQEEDDDDDDDDFVDAEESGGLATPTTYQGHLDSTDLSTKLNKMALNNGNTGLNGSNADQKTAAALQDELRFEDFSNHPIDIFIHSGTNLCFGILQLMLSLIPPAFSKLLYIVGFKGDREAGIEMLWRATKYPNINGAMAGLVTLGFYNGFIGFCDILRQDSYPEERCRALLNDMRSKYPQSRLWRLEEARMLAGDKRLEEAVEMTGTEDPSPLKQVLALQFFERSLDCMYLHRYEDCATSFMKCVDLNNWSHGLYYYIAGSCHVELYRLEKMTNPAKAKKHAERATELLNGVTERSGKKRFMARQLPFDVFVTRKIQKWQERAKDWNVPFVDAVGVSPVNEMIWMWTGFKKMRPEQLETTLQRLAWSEDTTLNPTWTKEALDEKAILALVRATAISRLGRTGEAKEILKSEILSHEWVEFKGGLKDNWTLPVAHYEMVVNLWMECGGERGTHAQLQECSEWLEKVAKWETYDLDSRVGLKVTTARETLRKCGVVVVS